MSNSKLNFNDMYSVNNNVLKSRQIMTKKINEPSYFDLKKTFEHVENIFDKFVQQNNTRNIRSIYQNYHKYPQLPRKIKLTENEIKLKIDYIIDHYPLLHDIRNEREFQALTIIFGEYKVSLLMEECETSIPIFEKISSFKTVLGKTHLPISSTIKTVI